MFDFMRETVFCLGHHFVKHKMTGYAKNFWRPWPPPWLRPWTYPLNTFANRTLYVLVFINICLFQMDAL